MLLQIASIWDFDVSFFWAELLEDKSCLVYLYVLRAWHIVGIL